MALGASGCASGVLRAGPGFDFGTLGVSGVETGVGTHAEVVGFKAPAGGGLGLGVSLELAGYASDGDADPIAFTTVEARWRRPPPSGSGLYWELGSGVGLAWSPAVQRASLPLQGEVGWQFATGPAWITIGARERFLGLVGSGSPPVDAFNSVQLLLGVGWGAGPR